VSLRARLEDALDVAAAVLVAGCVVAAAAGSSIQYDILHVGRPARWVMIGVLLAFGLACAVRGRRAWRIPAPTALALAAFCGLALVSASWSVNSHGTLVRSVALAAVVAAVVALAGCVPSRPALGDWLLDGVLAAASIVAFAGFVYWLVHPSRAAIPATTEYPARFQGIEENPNTAALLLGIGMPLAFSRALRARSTTARIAFVGLVAAFAASIAASGSRGGLLAGLVGLLVVAALVPARPRTRIVLAALIVCGFAVTVWAMTIPKALPATPLAATSTSSASRDAESVLPLDQEIGNPWWTHRAGDSRRGLLNTSVRARAWDGTVRRAFGRPLLGYGFGAEQWAFINRYYALASQNPENGYIGLLLQLGLAGTALFLVVVGLCLARGVRACLRAPRSGYALAATGAAAAALAASISQSYFQGPGSIAFVAFWVALLVAAVSRRVDAA
jgi:O-antigen ligase